MQAGILFERVWFPLRRWWRRLPQLRIERDYWKARANEGDQYHHALVRITKELGVPGEGYPAPVANAWYIADAALHSHAFSFDGDEEYSSIGQLHPPACPVCAGLRDS